MRGRYGSILDEIRSTGELPDALKGAVETFTKEGDEWVQTDEDACWGFIGGEYAEQEMKSVFDYHCKKIFGGQQ